FGPITGFGSIFVNGREIFLTGDTALSDDDGNPLDEADLGLGQVVQVAFTTDPETGRDQAEEVTAVRDLKGPVSAVDTATSTLTVLGQTVAVDPLTVIEDHGGTSLALADLAAGNLVEVSGLMDGQGTLHATRVERRAATTDPATELEVKGTVAGLTATSFTLGDLTVDYSHATVEDDLAEGAFVEAKGVQPDPNHLTATRVELKERNPAAAATAEDQGKEAEVEGFVTAFTAASEFEVNGLPVVTSGATTYENGAASSLGLGVKVEVEGHLDDQGRLAADKVSFRESVRLEADVDAGGVDATAGTVSVFGGLTVVVTAATELRDQRDKVEPFTLASLTDGDRVEVRGLVQEGASGPEILALRLERRQAETRVALRGPVDPGSVDPAGARLTILGVAVDLGGASPPEGLTLQQLLDRAEGATLDVDGDRFDTAASVIVAREVELDD
ncbi:MAG: hypothetical protein D6739_06150, partial [Nitrospirae bacterium]